MPSEGPENRWPAVSVRDVAAVNPESTKGLGEDHPIRYIDISSVDSSYRITDDLPEMTLGEAPRRAMGLVRVGDIRFSTVRSERRSFAVVPPEHDRQVASTGFAVIRPSAKVVDPAYLWAAVRAPSFVAHIVSRQRGSNYPAVSPKDVADAPLLLPPIAEQRQIGWVLGSLDGKIESNRRLARSLEEIAACLFKARFADFVGQDDLVESEIGPVPRRWDLQPLGRVSSLLTRGRAPVYDDDGEVLVVNQKCVRSGRVAFDLARRHDEQARSSGDRRLQSGDALVNSTGVGTLGRVSQVRWLPGPATVDSHVTIVRAAPADIDQDYLALNLMSRQGELERMGHGSTGQTELSRSRLAEMPILVPPREEQQALSRFYSPIRERIGALEREAITLTEVRDALLPKLTSGTLRVDPASFEEGSR
jgi:type I restriction enzyme S subunit